MKISVIIPTYKPQSYIWECLDSFCDQTFPKNDFEVILVLNGCKEPYDDQIREYMSNHPDVQWNFIQTNQGGVSNARNIGLDAAKGEYIGFVDDDDYVSGVYLEELYKKAATNKISVSNTVAFSVVGGGKLYRQIYRVQRHYNARAPYGIQPFYKAECFSGPCMKLIHRELIGSRRFNTAFKNGEDMLFLYEISDRFDKVDFTSPNAIYYRNIRIGSATTSLTLRRKMLNCWRLAKEYTRIYFSNTKAYSLRFYISHLIGLLKIIIAG